IQDGAYKIAENIINFISDSSITLEDLNVFYKLVEENNNKKISSVELKKTTEEKIPKFIPLLDWIIPRNREEKFSMGMVFLGAALSLLTSAFLNNQPTENISPITVINNVYEIQENNNN